MELDNNNCHFLITGNKIEHVWAKILWESINEELLGVTMYNELKFNKHVSILCLKAGIKLTAIKSHNHLFWPIF